MTLNYCMLRLKLAHSLWSVSRVLMWAGILMSTHTGRAYTTTATLPANQLLG